MAEVKVTKATQPAMPAMGPMTSLFEGWDFSPFSLMKRFSEELDRFFANTAVPMLGREFGGWAPAIEVAERNGNLMIKAELPGLKQEEIKVEASEDGLTIEGERKHEAEEKKEGYYRSERAYGKFYRCIPLPEGAELEKAKAEYVNGVLEVTVPVPMAKKERRKIPVHSKAA